MTITIPITEYRNAKVIEADGSRIDVEINHPEAGWIPYTLDMADTDMTIDNDALLTLIGDDKEAYVGQTPEQIEEALAAEVRLQRDFLLAEMDQVISNQIRFNAMSTQQQNQWTTYRQALLDVPQQSGFPETVGWPQKPDA
tara:strand:- start:260 stop:682 length:423 start_codon:yes stop_codon:yes gene_type:complete